MMQRLVNHMTEYFFGHLRESEDEYLDDDLAEYLIAAANEQLRQLKQSDKKSKKKKGK